MDYDDFERQDASVKVSLAFALSSQTAGQTRSTDQVIQNGTFRGISELYVIPFSVRRAITAADQPKLFSPTGGTEDYSHATSRYYYFDQCSFMEGVASFLIYGKATPESGGKAVNGSLTASFPADMAPAGTTFSVEPIRSSTEAHQEAQDIAAYLTDIANTEGWATTTDSRLQAYYRNFIGQGSDAPSVLAGSSASVKAYTQQLKALLEAETNTATSELRQSIIANIGKTFPENYPASIGLPDGAAALRWERPNVILSAYAFVPQTVTTTEANINSINRFAYPPELCYYGNSQIKTSTKDDRKSYYNAENSWDDVLSHYENDPGIVSNNTKAVAIKNTVQYAVARLDAKFHAAATVLKDAVDNNVSISGIELTGIIVGGQRPVGFDFTPKSNSDMSVSFVYDTQVQKADGSHYPLSIVDQGPLHTLLLQSADGEDVTIMLEFANNSGHDFAGATGTIYDGTKFYLAGTIKLGEPGTADYTKRVFTQDYTTAVDMTVESLAKAYNAMPNLLSPQLEIGVRLTTKWEQSTPTTVILE